MNEHTNFVRKMRFLRVAGSSEFISWNIWSSNMLFFYCYTCKFIKWIAAVISPEKQCQNNLKPEVKSIVAQIMLSTSVMKYYQAIIPRRVSS